jgi:hypothetical protein
LVRHEPADGLELLAASGLVDAESVADGLVFAGPREALKDLQGHGWKSYPV